MLPIQKSAYGAVLFLVLSGRVGGARAQDTIPPVSLDTVQVTVLRTPQSLAVVPYAVDVKRETEIQRARPGLGLDEALHGIPGVQVDNRYNYALGERISIRGFGARTQFGVRGVRILVDGIPATLPDGQSTLSHVDLHLLRRVEVVRGPASSLYGNAAGGVIQLETEEAPPVPLGQEVGVIAGENGLLRLHSTTAGRSGGTSYLFNVARLAYGGYRDFSTAENLYVNARLGYRSGRDELRLLVNAVDYGAQNPGSLSDSLLTVDRAQAFRFNKIQQTGEEGRQGQVGALWRRALDAGQLEVSGYALAREIDNPIPPVIIDLDRTAGGVRTLFHSRTPVAAGAVRWALGAEADLQRDDRANFANDGGNRGILRLDQLERVRNLSAFLQLGAEPLPRMSLLGGVRYDHIRFAVDDRLIREGNPDDSGSRILDAVSPSLGLTYAVSDALNLYGNVATSFQTPTTTELANRPSGAGGFNPELEPQRAVSYEVGLKGQRGLATYQLAAYRADVEDALIPFEVPGAEGRQFFRNAGSSVHQGIEAGATVAVFRNVRARAAYTLTDAHFESYTVGDAELGGNRIPGVARHRVEGGLSYEAPVGMFGSGGWFAEVDGRYSSDVPVNDRNTASSPEYTLVDARVGLTQLRIGRVDVSPFAGVTNLFDQTYNTSVVVNAFGGRFYEPGPGRQFYLGLRAGV